MNNSETIYRQILQKSLDRITEEIVLLQTQNKGLLKIFSASERRIEKLRIEREQIQSELNERDKTSEREDSIPNGFLDGRINAITEKQTKHSQQLSELEQSKKYVHSYLGKMRINSRIKHERKKILRLKSTKNIISDVQKAMMMPKHVINRYRLGKYAKRQGDVNYFQNKLQDSEAKKELANTTPNIIGNVMSVYYDFRGKYYAKKLEKAASKLEKLKKPGVQTHFFGANPIVIPKRSKKQSGQAITAKSLAADAFSQYSGPTGRQEKGGPQIA